MAQLWLQTQCHALNLGVITPCVLGWGGGAAHNRGAHVAQDHVVTLLHPSVHIVTLHGMKQLQIESVKSLSAMVRVTAVVTESQAYLL